MSRENVEAIIKAVYLSIFCTFKSTFALINAFTISVFPFSKALIKAVFPYLSCTFKSTFASINAFTFPILF